MPRTKIDTSNVVIRQPAKSARSSRRFDLVSLAAFGIILVWVFIFGSAFGVVVGLRKATTISDQLSSNLDDQNFSLYWKVYQILKDQYVDEDKVAKAPAYYGTIKGMVDSIGDPATAFYTPEETKMYNQSMSGTYEGIGAELGYKNSMVVVISPLKGSPATKAGILAGDIILKVDGTSMEGKSVYDAVSLIRGKAGTKVVLSISRRVKQLQKTMDIEIVRGQIAASSMELKGIKDGIAQVEINRFVEDSSAQWQAKWDAIATQMQQQQLKGIILDLRNNGGGFFDAAIYLAEDFLNKGDIVAKQKGKGEEMTTFRVSRVGRFTDVPLVILVNSGSASASEIFAGAIQVHQRGEIIGTDTYGKGTVQIIENLDDGSSLHITIMKWLLPDDKVLDNEHPIIPDLKVEFDQEKFLLGTDNQLNRAMEYLQKGK